MFARFGRFLYWTAYGGAVLAILAAPAAAEESPILDIVVLADETVLVEGEAVSGTAALEAKLSEVARRAPKPMLRVLLNQDVGYEAVANVLRVVQRVDLSIGMRGYTLDPTPE